MTTASISSIADPGAAGLPAVHAGYGVSLTDLAGFEQALARAGASGPATLQARPVEAPGQAMQALFKPLEHINGEAATLSADASAAVASGRSMTPSEMILLTVRCHEFMFHCQLTSNAANRTSDGLQQLFRQQS
jgi:hypothetical protein